MNEIEQIIEEKIWEQHEGCEIKPDEYKEFPEKCCYKHCAKAIEQYVIKAIEKETIVTHSDTEDWSDDKVSGYLLKIREIQKHIAELKKGLNEK